VRATLAARPGEQPARPEDQGGTGDLDAGGRVAVADLEAGYGIVVDANLLTSAPGVFAAGDAANAWHLFCSRAIRVEHSASALRQGCGGAWAMLGQPVSYDHTAYVSDTVALGWSTPDTRRNAMRPAWTASALAASSSRPRRAGRVAAA
jgi:hypothetical protein